LLEQASVAWRPILYDVQALRSVGASPAATVHRFNPIGNGYFYSAYEESMFEVPLLSSSSHSSSSSSSSSSAFSYPQRVAKFAGMAMEGSMDIQLADFFQECTAGTPLKNR